MDADVPRLLQPASALVSQGKPFSSPVLGKLGGIYKFGELVTLSEHHSSPSKICNLTGASSLHWAHGFSSEKETHIS